MALNDYVTIGNSGLRVSPFCLGAMHRDVNDTDKTIELVVVEMK